MTVLNKYTNKYGFHYSTLYIVTHNLPYISSCKPGLSEISTEATYEGMIMCDHVGCSNEFHYLFVYLV